MSRMVEGMTKNMFFCLSVLIVISLTVMGSIAFADESSTSWAPFTSERSGTSEEIRTTAKSKLPMITNPDHLPPRTRELLGLDGSSGVGSHAYGTGGHPFTTKRSGASITKSSSWLRKDPWRGTGKLWMRFGFDWYVCTASVIDKGLIVTAAHCVHNYGDGDAGWADEVIFEAARHEKKKTLKSWTGISYTIPTVYFDGTDICASGSDGVVCENDIAIVVLKKKSKSYVSKKSGQYGYAEDNYGYTSFLGEMAAQITELGYPVALDGGLRMIRTDSLGYQDNPSNVVIGSDQTGGSSGGPWFVNFGVGYESFSSMPTDQDMRVMAVTSWGYTDSNVKIQGASRFARNTNFITQSNIDSLHEDVCMSYPNHCD